MDVVGVIGAAGILLGFIPIATMGEEKTERIGAVVTSMIFIAMGIVMILFDIET